MTKTITNPKPTTQDKKGAVRQVSPLARELKHAAQAIGVTPKDLGAWFSKYPQLSEVTQETCLRWVDRLDQIGRRVKKVACRKVPADHDNGHPPTTDVAFG